MLVHERAGCYVVPLQVALLCSKPVCDGVCRVCVLYFVTSWPNERLLRREFASLWLASKQERLYLCADTAAYHYDSVPFLFRLANIFSNLSVGTNTPGYRMGCDTRDYTCRRRHESRRAVEQLQGMYVLYSDFHVCVIH